MVRNTCEKMLACPARAPAALDQVPDRRALSPRPLGVVTCGPREPRGLVGTIPNLNRVESCHPQRTQIMSGGMVWLQTNELLPLPSCKWQGWLPGERRARGVCEACASLPGRLYCRRSVFSHQAGERGRRHWACGSWARGGARLKRDCDLEEMTADRGRGGGV